MSHKPSEMPAAVEQRRLPLAPSVGRGSVELSGHPKRYSMSKLRGVRKKKKPPRLYDPRSALVATVVAGTHGNGTVFGVSTDADAGSRDYRTQKKEKKKTTKNNVRTKKIGLDTLDSDVYFGTGHFRTVEDLRHERVKYLMKLAEDGRKKSTLLPPLEKEASFARAPRKGATQSSFSDDVSETKKLKQVSIEMDRKIVSHLRRHLNKRTQRRMDGLGETLEYPSDEDDKNDNDKASHKGKDVKQVTIFSKYSETGEKILMDSRGKPRSKRPSFSKSPSRRSSHNKMNGNGVDTTKLNGHGGVSESDPLFTKIYPLPGIPPSRPNIPSHRHHSLVASEYNRIRRLASEDSDIELQDNEEEESDSDHDMRPQSISPILTPSACRPETREKTMADRSDRMLQILDGHAHQRCPSDHTVVNLYIASGYTDTEEERSFMQEHAFPRLRTHFKQLGHELRILDLHWGFKDAVLDDHKLPEVIKSLVAKCHETPMGINFVILLGQRYGPYMLPPEIPKDEMDAICKMAQADKERQMMDIQRQMTNIESMKAEREQSKIAMDDAESVATDGALESARQAPETKVVEEEKEEGHASGTDSNSGAGNENTSRQRQTLAIRREQQAMRQVKEAEERLPALDQVKEWYLLDENVCPPVYRLQNISTAYKDILRTDFHKRSLAKASFSTTADKLLDVLQTYSPQVIRDKRALRRYFMSAIEVETDAILDHVHALRHTTCLIRTIDEVEDHLDDPASGVFLDLASEKPPVLDVDRHVKIQQLRASLSQGKLCERQLGTFLLEWSPGGVSPLSNREHLVHVDRVSRAMVEMVTSHLTDSFGGHPDVSTWRSRLFDEVAEHLRCCQKKCQTFQGRKDILTLLKTYIKSESKCPFVLHGKTGSGKSAILAKACKEINRWFKGSDQEPRVLVRMIGSTMPSTNVRTLLHDVCLQMCHMFGQNPSEVPTDYKGVFNDFAYRIGHATYRNPLVIVLDAVDRLSDEHEARKLQWLPPELPPHVYLIVSTISDEKFDCLPCARKLLAGTDAPIEELPTLPEDDAAAMLEHWMHTSNRRVTSHQHQVIMDCFKKCAYPLYLKLAFNEVIKWPSYMKQEQVKLGETVKKVATLRFGRLERDHGEVIVRRALGYISASRNGIASNEMEDVLSLDEAVMDDVVATHRPPCRRLPPLLWLRLLEDLWDLLAECRADNYKTLSWAHTPISEAAEERYLLQRDKAPSYHKPLAEYFLGMWVGNPKPFTGNEKGSDRFVSEQVLFYEPPGSCGDGSDRVFNLRKINELPFHLMRSQQTGLLKKHCLCNYEWMLAKLCGTSLRALLEEYQAILSVEPHEPEIRMLSDVLHLSGKALVKEPRQLASQLVGRLYKVVATDTPRAPGDPRKFPNIHPLLVDAKASSVPALIPSIECLTEPGGILFDILSGHSEPITAMTMTTDGMRSLTTSQDKTMKLWDIRSGKVVKSIEGVGRNVSAIRTAKSNSVAITVTGNVIQIWSLQSGECIFTIDDCIDPAKISVAAEGQILVAVFDGSNSFRSWSMDDFSKLCNASIPDNSIHKENSILIADSSYGDIVLHAFRSANTASLQHARNGKIVKTLQCHEKSSSIVALAISREYFIVCARQQYMALHEIHVLELFDAKKGTYLRSVRGCVHDNIQELFINLVGSHAIAVCASAMNNNSNIALWNLETEDHKHLANHPCVSTMGACLDFKYCMTGAIGETFLRIWDLSTKVNQPAPKLKKQLGICDILPMIDNPRYVVAKSIHNGPISVWNIDKGKCLQSAVRIERGLTEGSDALIMRNTRLVILTDRGFSSVSDDSRPVFQTVLVYDLKLKKYIRKLPGCYIVPAPSHEYVLLEDDMLLGPSDNRSHFIIWNLVTGHAASRIKTGFKELERKRMEQGAGLAVLTDVSGRVKRATSSMMTPWDRRAESRSARKRREEKDNESEKQRLEELRKEKDNVVEQFIVSGDQKKIVASFYAHHLCVFDIETQTHTQTLQTEYSMMFLHTAALTFDGSHLVIANYDEDSKISYVTLWDCTTGEVKRRLKNETNVSALAITDDAKRVVIGRSPNEVHVWDPMTSSSLRRIRGHDNLRFEMKSKIFVSENGTRAIVFAGDISIWDLEKATILAVFTPDTRITVCNVVLNGSLIVFGMYEKQDLVILKVMGDKISPLEDTGGANLFGEVTDTSDEEDDEDEENYR